MVNPTDEAQGVEMVFPYIGQYIATNIEDIVVTSNEEPIAYSVYPGEIIPTSGNQLTKLKDVTYDFEEILKSINNEKMTVDIES